MRTVIYSLLIKNTTNKIARASPYGAWQRYVAVVCGNRREGIRKVGNVRRKKLASKKGPDRER